MKWPPRPKRRVIGPRMRAATRYVAGHPGCTKQQVSVVIGPHGSNLYGSLAVNRAIDAGLIQAEGTSRGYRLTVTDEGRKVAER